MRRKRPILAEALTGRFTDHHAFMARTMLDRIDACTAMEDRITAQIDVQVAPFRRQLALIETIPAVGRRAAEIILAEIGADPSRFPTGGHLASWAGMCPGNNQSRTRTKATPTRHGDPWLKGILGQVAVNASPSKGSTLCSSPCCRSRHPDGTKTASSYACRVTSTCPSAAWTCWYGSGTAATG